MARVRQLAHEGIGDGTPASRASAYKCGEGLWSENIYRNGPWSKQQIDYFKMNEWKMGKGAVASWMKSPGHRKNLLDSQWVVMGAGVGQNGTGEFYATQTFGPLKQMPDEKLVLSQS